MNESENHDRKGFVFWKSTENLTSMRLKKDYSFEDKDTIETNNEENGEESKEIKNLAISKLILNPEPGECLDSDFFSLNMKDVDKLETFEKVTLIFSDLCYSTNKFINKFSNQNELKEIKKNLELIEILLQLFSNDYENKKNKTEYLSYFVCTLIFFYKKNVNLIIKNIAIFVSETDAYLLRTFYCFLYCVIVELSNLHRLLFPIRQLFVSGLTSRILFFKSTFKTNSKIALNLYNLTKLLILTSEIVCKKLIQFADHSKMNSVTSSKFIFFFSQLEKLSVDCTESLSISKMLVITMFDLKKARLISHQRKLQEIIHMFLSSMLNIFSSVKKMTFVFDNSVNLKFLIKNLVKLLKRLTLILEQCYTNDVDLYI